MKQKIVLKVTMTSGKFRSKAMKVAVGVAAVESVAIQGDDKNQIVVIGDGIDSVMLTNLLRKHIGYTELVSVGPVDKKKEEEKNETKIEPLMYHCQFGVPPVQHGYYSPYECRSNDSCTIM